MPTTKSKTYLRILNFFIGLTVLALVLILHFTVSSATITINRPTQDFAFDAPLAISQSANIDILTTSTVSLSLTGSQAGQVSQKTTTGSQAAVTVTIYNNYSQAQPLVATTRLLSADNKLFRLTEGVTVPAGASVQTIMEADQAGDDYLVPAGRFTIPGLWAGLQDKIYGQTDQTASYDRVEAQVLTQSDIDEAVTKIIADLQPQALEQLSSKINGQPLTAKQLLTTASNVKSDKKIGSQTTTFNVTASVLFQALPLAEEPLRQLAAQKLQEKLPADVKLVELKNDSFSYQLQSLDSDNQAAVLNVHLVANITDAQGFVEIDKSKLTRLTAAEATKYLSEQGITNAQITLFPVWLRRLPLLTDHIRIEYQDL